MLATILMLTLAATPGAYDPAAHVRDILATKCTQCHGATLPHPKGRFGFITDLRRLAKDPDYIVPGNPDSSYLWNQIDDGEMPPKKAKAGPLTDDEKAAIQAWIKDGATPPLVDEPLPAPAVGDESSRAGDRAGRDTADAAAPHSVFDRAAAFVGKLHILTIHFPIALLVAAAAAESWATVRRRVQPLEVVRFCLWLGAAAAVASAGLGWLHAHYMDEESEQLLLIHRWIGTAVGVLAPLVAAMAERDARQGARRTLIRWSIIGLGLLVGAAGHFGGLLVYGANFLSF